MLFHIARGVSRGAVVAAAVTACLIVTGCGSSDDSSTSSQTSTGSAAQASTASTDTVKTKAEAAIAQVLKQPTSIGQFEPLGADIPKNKTIVSIFCSLPSCQAQANALQDATKAVGWTFKNIDGGLTPETIKAAWDQAVKLKPDGVVTVGFSRQIYESELKTLHKAGTVIVAVNTGDPPSPETITFAGQGWNEGVGTRLANYALSQDGDKVKALSVFSKAFAIQGWVSQGFEKTIKDACSSCTHASLEVPVTAIGKNLPQLITGYLNSHPDINWVYLGYNDMALGLPAALKSAGIDGVKFVTLDNGPADEKYVADGTPLVAEDAYTTHEFMWAAVDRILRSFTGKTGASELPSDFPVWVLTKDNMPAERGYFPLVNDYEAQFKKAWGIG
jgi:ribose transport system substrate-binding protein